MSQNEKDRVYVSHSIRGKLGVNATPESMAENNRIAHEAVCSMRLIMPEIEFYVPGEHDEIISILYNGGKLKEEDILWADCELIKQTCKVLLAFTPDGFISGGMNIEIRFADEHSIPVYVVHFPEGLADIKSEILKYLQKGK